MIVQKLSKSIKGRNKDKTERKLIVTIKTVMIILQPSTLVVQR